MTRRFVTLARAALALALVPPLALAAQEPQTAPSGPLRPITLDQAIEMAQQNAPSAVAARGQIRTTSSAVRSAWGALLPSLSLSAGQNKDLGPGVTRVDPTRGDEYTVRPVWRYSTGFSANMNLFDGGRRWSDVARAKADVGTAEANEITQRYSIALQVKTQYYNVLAARESEGAARSRLEQAEQQLKVASARVAAGVATLSDSLRSVIQVGDARLALLTAQNSVRVASASLTRLVGTSFLVTANPTDTLQQLAPLPDSAALAAWASEGPAVRSAQAVERGATAARRTARASYFPTVSLSFQRSGGGSGNPYGIGRGIGDDAIWAATSSLRLNFNYALFDNFSREDAQVRAAVSLENSQAQLRDAQLLAQQNVVQQLGSLQTAEQRILIQQASVAAAQEDLRVMQQRYALGASTLLDLLTSQTNLNASRQALIEARRDYRIARAQLETVIGRDLP